MRKYLLLIFSLIIIVIGLVLLLPRKVDEVITYINVPVDRSNVVDIREQFANNRDVILEIKKVKLYSRSLEYGEIYCGGADYADGKSLTRLYGIAINDSGYIYVPSKIPPRVQVFDSVGNFKRVIKLADIKEEMENVGYNWIEGPFYIIVDHNGKIYLWYEVADPRYEIPDGYWIRFSNIGEYEDMFECSRNGFFGITSDNNIVRSLPGKYEVIDIKNKKVKTVFVSNQRYTFFPLNTITVEIYLSATKDTLIIKEGEKTSCYQIPGEVISERHQSSTAMFYYPNELHLYTIEDTTVGLKFDHDPFVRIVRYRLKI